MTGPDRPTPQPLPAPGPPPHLGVCRYPECECERDYACGDTAPTAGSGPTHPPGHPGTGSPPPPPPPKNQLPTLGMVIRDVERTLTQAITTLGRQYDPASGPSQQDDPWGPEAVDIHLGSAVADIRSALRELDAVTLLGLPPVGSAVQYPGPSDSSACLSGGSASHPVRRPGEGLRPGSAAGARTTSARSDAAYGGPLAGASHLAASSLAASGGLLPGLVDATPTAVDIDESVAPDAGESSGPWEANAARPAWCPLGATPATGAGPSPDPRPGCAEGARPAHDAADPPGVGFTLPVTQRFTMPGTEHIARSINEALTGRSW